MQNSTTVAPTGPTTGMVVFPGGRRVVQHSISKHQLRQLATAENDLVRMLDEGGCASDEAEEIVLNTLGIISDTLGSSYTKLQWCPACEGRTLDDAEYFPHCSERCALDAQERAE